MKAVYNDTVLAESDKTVYIEGNQYFPPESVNKEFFTLNDQHTTCFWKGEANYYDIEVAGQTEKGAAWYYPSPPQSAIDQVKTDFTGYVAFYPSVAVG